MIKSQELSDPSSCINRAKDDEMTFVLLARDEVAPYIIRMWVQERCRWKKNLPTDPQILEALACADKMQCQYEEIQIAKQGASIAHP